MSNSFLASSMLLSDQFELLIWATAGGVLVFGGLVMEKMADWMDERFLGGWRAHRKLCEAGWIVLMIGIAIEIADAGFAANDGWQTRQIAIKNDPRNARISYMYATAFLQVKGRQFNDLTNWNPDRVALITLCKNDLKHIPSFDWLEADTYRKGTYHNMFDVEGRGYAIRFQSWGFIPGMGFDSQIKDLDDINLLQMEVNFLPRGAEITGGGVELVANNLHKVFTILPQIDTNFPDGTPGCPYKVLATNWDKEMK